MTMLVTMIIIIVSNNMIITVQTHHNDVLLGGQLNHPDPKVGVVDVEVVGDAPHDDQVHPLLLQLPGQSARGSRKTVKTTSYDHQNY